MSGKRLSKSVDSLKEVVTLVDSLGSSVTVLEERLRGVYVQLSNMGQLPPINFNKQGSFAQPTFTPVSPALAHVPPPFSPAISTSAPLITNNAGSTDFSRAFSPLNQTLQDTNATLTKLTTTLESLAKATANASSPNQPGSTDQSIQNQQIQAPSGFGSIKPFLKAGTNGAAGIVLADYKLQEMMLESQIGHERRAVIARSQIAGTMQERALDSALRTDAASLLRYGGDILLPGQSRFLGSSGFNAALDVAGREGRLEIELAKTRNSQAIGHLIVGGATSALGFLAGGPVGIGAGILGLVGMGKGAGSLTNDKYSQLSDGGIFSSIVGKLIYGPAADSVAKKQQTAARAEFENSIVNRAISLQDAELSANKSNEAALSAYQKSVASRIQDASLIGGYAMSAYSGSLADVKANYEKSIESEDITPGGLLDLRRFGFNISSPYGKRKDPIDPSKIQLHKGIDYAAPAGTKIPALFSGKVVASGHGRDLGNYMVVQDAENPDIYNLYGHIAEKHAKKGDTVEKGQDIAEVADHAHGGARSTGDHFHLETFTPKKGYDISKSGYNSTKVDRFNPNTLSSKKTRSSGASKQTEAIQAAMKSAWEVTPGDINSEFNINETQFYNYRARLLNVMAPYNVTRDASGRVSADNALNIERTKDVLGLQQAGLGSFDSLLGNLAGLNTARGGGDNVSSLKEILTNAVATGFDRSRSAQQFVESVVDLSGRLGVTETNELSRQLAVSSRLFSADIKGDRSDEMGLAKARSAMDAVAAATSSTDGYLGALKAATLIRGGVTLDSGATLYSRLSTAQMQSFSTTLKNSGDIKNIEDLKNLKLEALVQAAPGSSVGDKVSFVENRLNDLLKITNTAFKSTAGVYSQKWMSPDALAAEIAGKDEKQQLAAIRKNAASYAVALSSSNKLGFEGSYQQYVDMISSQVSLKGNTLSDLRKFGREAGTDAVKGRAAAAEDTLGRVGDIFSTATVPVNSLRQHISKLQKGQSVNIPGVGSLNSVEDFDHAYRDPDKKKHIDAYRAKGLRDVSTELRSDELLKPENMAMRIDESSIKKLADEIVRAYKQIPDGSKTKNTLGGGS